MTVNVFRKRVSLLFLLGVLVLLVLEMGCSRTPKPDGLPVLRSCKITITQEGKGVEGVTVMLSPKEGENCPWAVTGVTDSGGTAQIQTHGNYRGAPEGTFRVLLSKELIDGANFESMERPSAKNPMIIYSLVDTKYTKLDTTPLELTVGRWGARETFEIGPAVREQTEVVGSGP